MSSGYSRHDGLIERRRSAPSMFERPRGTRDFGQAEMARRLFFENLLEERARCHAFKRVQTPIFENLDLFTAKSGHGVVGQLYAFQDKGERDLALRPELTAPVMRMIAAERGQMPKPAKLSYFGQCFRYEEFKKGRYREFYQYGCELIGATGPLAEAEVVALAVDMLDACGLVDWELRIGHVGITNDILTTLGLTDQPLGGTGEGTEGGESPVASAMRYLDKGDWDGLQELFAKHGISSAGISSLQTLAELKGGVETLSKAREILTELGVESDSLDELEQLCSALNHLAPSPPKLSVNLCVARGLDYYTGMVFEAHVEELGGEGQVLGGGTYRLLHLFDLGDLDPCCGFGLGFDRVLLALQAQAERLGRAEVVAGENSSRPALAVIPLNIEPENYLSLVADLRASGLVVELELRSRGVGKSLAWAENMGATHAIIIGQRDLDSGQITIKDLSTGEQTTAENNPQAILDNIL